MKATPTVMLKALRATNGISDKQVPVAICGMGMRLPGGIRNDAALYNFLVNGGDARTATGNDRYNVDAYYSPRSYFLRCYPFNC